MWIDPGGTVRVGALSEADESRIDTALRQRGLTTAGAVVPAASSVEDLEAVQYQLAQELRPVLAATA